VDHYLLSENKGLNDVNISINISRCSTEEQILNGGNRVVRELRSPSIQETIVRSRIEGFRGIIGVSAPSSRKISIQSVF